MKHSFRVGFAAVALWAGGGIAASAEPPPEHPFLLVKKPDYAALQELAHTSPGREMRDRAVALAGGPGGTPGIAPLAFDVQALPTDRGVRLADIFSTAALAYLLDEPNRPAYRDRIVSHMKFWDPAEPGNLVTELDRDLWALPTTQAGAFFNAALALDIVHDDVAPADLARVEAWLDQGPAVFFDEVRKWKASGHGARGAWALYRGDRAKVESCKKGYLREVLNNVSPDGGFIDGVGYALARWGDSGREQKQYFGDVLAFTGEYPGWYAEPRLRQFQEWLYGSALTPARLPWTVGDAAPGPFNAPPGFADYPAVSRNVVSNLTGFERAGRFSPQAARYAAWVADGATPGARLCAFLLMHRGAAPEPAVASSRIFDETGAYFREARPDVNALAGVLVNVRAGTGHTHKETNALCLAGYGQTLLRNSGYNGWATDASGFSWEYINRWAVSGNAALIDYEPRRDGGTPQRPSPTNDHRDTGGEFGSDGKSGAGVRGFVTGSVDYAAGDSGNALPNGKHLREFLMVHPQDGAAGYFVAFDFLHAYAGGKFANVAWHPNSATAPRVLADGEAYEWRVTPSASAALTVFLATPPASLDLLDGVLARWGGGFVGKYLFTRYDLDPENGWKRIVTVLYPHDDAHPPAALKRIAGPGWTGAEITSAGGVVVDQAVELDPYKAALLPGGVEMQAAQALHRRIAGTPDFFFARQARGFRDGDRGFSCLAPVTIFLKNGRGRVESTGAVVRFFAPGVTGLKLDDAAVALTSAGPGFVEAAIPAGTHAIALIP